VPDDVWLTAYRSRAVFGGATAFCTAIVVAFVVSATSADGGIGSWAGAVLFIVLDVLVGKELLDPRPVIRVDAEGVQLRSPRCDLRWFEIEAVQLHVRRTGAKGAYAWLHLLLTDTDRQIGRHRGRAVTQAAFLTRTPSDIVDAIGRGLIGEP
jgi:hypothetical protein